MLSSGFGLTVEIFGQMVFIYSVVRFWSNDPIPKNWQCLDKQDRLKIHFLSCWHHLILSYDMIRWNELRNEGIYLRYLNSTLVNVKCMIMTIYTVSLRLRHYLFRTYSIMPFSINFTIQPLSINQFFFTVYSCYFDYL